MNVQLENMTVSRSVSTHLDHTCVGVILAISWVRMDIHVKVCYVALYYMCTSIPFSFSSYACSNTLCCTHDWPCMQQQDATSYVLSSLLLWQIDYNECLVAHYHGCSHGCVNTKGSYHCTCPEGFTMRSDKRTCEGRYRWRTYSHKVLHTAHHPPPPTLVHTTYML